MVHHNLLFTAGNTQFCDTIILPNVASQWEKTVKHAASATVLQVIQTSSAASSYAGDEGRLNDAQDDDDDATADDAYDNS